MNTITLNEALKQRVYDSVAISEITASSLNADTVDADTVTTAPETIHLGAVDLGNNFPKYLTIADPNGGLQAATTSSNEIRNLGLLLRDQVIVHGDPRTSVYIGFDHERGLFSAPTSYVSNVVLSTDASQEGPQEIVTVGSNDEVYEVKYNTGSLGLTANVESVTWWFSAPTSRFRVIITELSSGVVTYITHKDEEFLAGAGFDINSSGENTWQAIIPALWTKGLNYEVKAQSLDSDFNIKGSYDSEDNFIPYAIFTGWAVDGQPVVYFPLWEAKVWTVGDCVWYSDYNIDDPLQGGPIHRGNVYKCTQTGLQVGSFLDNLAQGLWKRIQDTPALLSRRNNSSQTIPKNTDTIVLFNTQDTAASLRANEIPLEYSSGVFTNVSDDTLVLLVNYNFSYEPNSVGDRRAWVRLNGQNGRKLCYSTASAYLSLPVGFSNSFNLTLAPNEFFSVVTRQNSSFGLDIGGISTGIDVGYSTKITITRL